ncbi:UNVERIFIED_CONTAM: histone H3-lysine(4) N-trimethyltransferase ATX1 [Sesamum calycinum]|uniref:Histone H3-lysine(4) N-trimethyltransferase ATX1 n=1 Tax=Sesamum calycinum TaxID=2727403 RepID=A0AAW2P6G6_9LAMI
MTGGGRCQRRRKPMAGGRGTAEAKKFDSNCNRPNLNPEITEKPSASPNITKPPPSPAVGFDLYTQARKVLSFRSPFDSEDAQAPQAFVSGANTLPSGVSQLLTRHSDSRKRHKKLHSGSENKSSTPGRPRGSNFWAETEEYFRELTAEDIERLDRVSRVGYSGNEKWFLIPSLDNENTDRYGTFNRMLASACEKDILNFENGVELNSNGKLKFNELMVQDDNGPRSMDIDGDVVETEDCSIKEESNGEKIQTTEKESTSFSGVEWLLGSRSKIYLASERPSKKRKLLGRDAGLEKLLVARAVEGSDSVCHYCSFGDTGDPLNCLIKCASCGMVVHQRCYGVQEDVDSSWLCSWCKWKNVTDLSTGTPCLLCPRQGGALKPVRKRGYGSENDGSKMEFAHLFCCQWMPEVYLENTRTMEPIMNMDELKDTRRKLICYLCKVKSGACLRCSNGSCRTSFHPICAREARHRMEIWGKLGSDEVELRAFCSKHSEVHCESGSQDTGDTSLPGNSEYHVSWHQEMALTVNESHKREVLPDNGRNSESHQENGDALDPAAKYSTNRNDKEDVNAYALNFTMILKKLIDLGKVNAKDVASEIGVSPDSLNAILDDNHMVPELQCKLLRWLKKPCSHWQLTKDTESPNGTTLRESLADESKKSLVDPEQHQDDLLKDSIRIEDELRALAQSLYEDDLDGETKQSRQMTNCSLMLTNGEVNHSSYVHPFIYSKMMQSRSNMLDKTPFYQSGGKQKSREGKSVAIRAQAVLAAATAAAAASSRISSIRKDAVEESSQQEDRAKTNVSERPGFYSQLNRRVKETLSRRSETVLNPILVCSSCKVAVHLDCYRSVKSTTGPWHCELCEHVFSSRGSGALATNSWEKPYFVAECGLCGGTAGAFRKSIDGQWIHALCAEWVLESTYRRGQVNPIEGMDTVCRGVDTCTVCRRKQGVCLKCSYGHCQTTFHPTCARCAGFYMTVRTNGGKLQHKAYCEKHSIEQKAKVELERLRLLCERIIKREKLKHAETFEKELIMTSDQASVKNQRLPKGFVYVPVRCLSKDKETVPDACSREPMERNG